MSIKIKLDKNAGPIVFLGSMNSMPMMYALDLKSMGYEVLYLVDCPTSDVLNRPENHFKEIPFPYPSWIVEFNLKSQILLPFFSFFLAKIIERKLGVSSDKPVQVYVLNGLFFSLAPFLNVRAKKIALAHGSDLDSWCDIDDLPNLILGFKEKSFFKYLPSFLSGKLIAHAVNRQYEGAAECDRVIYFPRGFSKKGDRVLSKLKSHGVQCSGRYDVSFEPLKGQCRSFKEPCEKLVFFSGVRFMYDTFSEGNEEYNKGNDFIIIGLSRYYKENKNIEIHFIEKGPDVEKAKQLCIDTGLSEAVTWHPEMKFTELLNIYIQADICFDQVGSHWIGAIGAYALWLGKPLIANDYLPVNIGFWPKTNPIYSASSSVSVYDGAKFLSCSAVRRKISEESKSFAEVYFNSRYLLNDIFDF